MHQYDGQLWVLLFFWLCWQWNSLWWYIHITYHLMCLSILHLSTPTDIDECTLGLDNCSPNATCMNTIGSFECVCSSGFSGNGTVCSGICTHTHNYQQCYATISISTAFFYTYNTDIDECALGLDNCSPSATCINSIGSFQCECLPGYSGDGVTCEGQ